MSRFASNHPIPLLRGRGRLSSGELAKAMEQRIDWLVRKITEAKANEIRTDRMPLWRGPLLDELKAIVQLLETNPTTRKEG